MTVRDQLLAACEKTQQYADAHGPRAGVGYLSGALQGIDDPHVRLIGATIDRMLRPWAYRPPQMGGPGYTCALCGGIFSGERVDHAPGCSADR